MMSSLRCTDPGEDVVALDAGLPEGCPVQLLRGKVQG
jgi:hypothetical protein